MTAPVFHLGFTGVLQVNTGSYNSPTWVAINNVGDLDMPFEFEEAEATNRASAGFEMVMPSIQKINVEFDMKYDTTDTQWSGMLTQALGRTVREFAVADGLMATTGTQALRCSMVVTKFGRKEALKEIMVSPVTLRPTPSANAPSWSTT